MNDRVLVRIKFTITTKRNSTKFQFNSIQYIFLIHINIKVQLALARIAARFPVTAWKPCLMDATEHRDPQASHCKKKRRKSFWRRVFGERQVWQVTYSFM